MSKSIKSKKSSESAEATISNENFRAARALILQILYEIDVARHDTAKTLAYHLAEAELEYNLERFVRSQLLGVLQHQAVLDDYIRELASSWPLEQMAAIDRNILRLGMYELQHHPETKQTVVIHEAIQLARQFGSNSSPRFVNGVLETFISKKL